MPDLRARAGDLCMADAMPFNQHHEYRTTIPLKDVINSTFFNSVASNLRAGDSITLCSFVNGDWTRLAEIATVRVVEKTKDAVKLAQIGEIVPVKEAAPVAPEAAGEYAPEGSKAEWKGPSHKYAILDKAGKEIARGIVDKTEAEQIARGERALPAAPVPEKAAA